MYSKKIFGTRVASLRISQNLSQQELGNALGVTKATISRLESGDRAPSIEVLSALADYFQIPSTFLLNEKPFQQWEELMQQRDAFLDAMAEFGPARDILEMASLPDLISLFASIVVKVAIDPQSHAITLFPCLPLEEIRRNIASVPVPPDE